MFIMRERLSKENSLEQQKNLRLQKSADVTCGFSHLRRHLRRHT